MGIKKIINKVTDALKLAKGEESKDKDFSNENTFPDEATAAREFDRSKQKLFAIESWSEIDGLTSTFELYNERGHKAPAATPKEGYYIKITLPATPIENWVRISEINTDKDVAEIVVHPSEAPKELTEDDEVVQHFFAKEASSTFRVIRQGNKIIGFEIGRDQAINNQGEEAGDRAVLNTLISAGGWAGFQEIQWENLTRYLVHLTELDNN